MTDNYGDWHEREMIDYADQARERDAEWVAWEAEQQREKLSRDEPVKKVREKSA